MNTSELVYEGELRTRATHMYSGTQLFTDAPLDNEGKAGSFSPSDLVATALAACMMTIMGIKARSMNIPLDGSTMAVRKIMAPDPRRIVEVQIDFFINNPNLSERDRHVLEEVAKHCPVAKSIHPDIKQVVQFRYAG